ncbi:hypothetical protein [Nocardioides coralli]|uniref:hypothetical protein n=1 Tax=Nocardioides coralli TaxID=2872154 RepID=UPI001CA45FCD|nr:hypothetical protein [Nocardioides coralli]QZY29956.1 hypothetical protein K6T13_04520 [Nocardioides coralli]
MEPVAGRPARWSVRATGVASWLLPRGPARDRWRRELVAELYGLSPREQVRHTLGVVWCAPALRAAVTARDRVVGEPSVRRPLRCRLSLHRWRVASSEDGSYRFRRCARCRKEQTYDEPGHWLGGAGGTSG